jgi:hypothetical protein
MPPPYATGREKMAMESPPLKSCHGSRGFSRVKTEVNLIQTNGPPHLDEKIDKLNERSTDHLISVAKANHTRASVLAVAESLLTEGN